MSKYNAGDKFIIEIGEEYETSMKFGLEENSPVELFKIKGFNSLVFDDNGLDKLQKYDEAQIPYSEAYNKGLQDAWKLALKVSAIENKEGIPDEVCKKLFGTLCGAEIIREHTPQEVLEKLEAYEQEKEIKMGDEVENPNNPKKYIVCNIKTGASISTDLRETALLELSCWQKTGKHIDIQSILDGIGEN